MVFSPPSRIDRRQKFGRAFVYTNRVLLAVDRTASTVSAIVDTAPNTLHGRYCFELADDCRIEMGASGRVHQGLEPPGQ